DIVQKIIDFMIKENKTLKSTEIANNRLKVIRRAHNTIKKYLEILKNLDLITIEKENKKVSFKINTEKYYKIRESILGG
ncbi:unnamed protein product, partial [marine sediment metagenome]